jgi:hypothetical protein
MKRCPQCNRVETDEALKFCRVDGETLVSDSGAISGEVGTAKCGSGAVSSEIKTSVIGKKIKLLNSRKAVSRPPSHVNWVKVDPMLDNLRTDRVWLIL